MLLKVNWWWTILILQPKPTTLWQTLLNTIYIHWKTWLHTTLQKTYRYVDGRDKHMTRWHNGNVGSNSLSSYPSLIILLLLLGFFLFGNVFFLFYFAELKECETLRLYGLWRQNPEKTFLVQIILITNHPTSAA